MYIPDEIRKCVVFIGYRLPDGEMKFSGTGFFASRRVAEVGAWTHVVTASHVIRGISALDNFDGKILLRINLADGGAETVEVDAARWLFHPEEPEVDVAVLPFFPTAGTAMDMKSLPYDFFLNAEKRENLKCGIGDEVFLPGLFYNHHGRHRNIPIVRVGNIAAMPEEKVLTKLGYIDAFLVEARSIGGLSGSPVFLCLGFFDQVNDDEEDTILMIKGRNGGPPERPRPRHYLLGLMHGHYNADLPNQDDVALDVLSQEVVNMGIAIVVPSEKIMEVLSQPAIRDREDEAARRHREAILPAMDSISGS